MAGDEKSVKVKIDHVEKIYDGRKGRMVALTAWILISWKMNLSAW